MPPRTCRVTITDMDGIEHTAQVAAGSLYEAIARGIASLRKQEWIDGLTLTAGSVTVEVGEAPVEHKVKLTDFHRWLGSQGRSPRDVARRASIREILQTK
jgi:hypothetical protein